MTINEAQWINLLIKSNGAPPLGIQENVNVSQINLVSFLKDELRRCDNNSTDTEDVLFRIYQGLLTQLVYN